jgi:hypothetical protein
MELAVLLVAVIAVGWLAAGLAAAPAIYLVSEFLWRSARERIPEIRGVVARLAQLAER